MVPSLPDRLVVALVTAVVTLLLVSAVPVDALPLFDDEVGPTDVEVVSLERLDAGCEDAVATYSQTGNGPNGTYETTSFIETGSRNAALSAWAERTSPTGADFSTFEVHVDSHRSGPTNVTCTVGVQYRLTVRLSGGSDGGLIPDASGTGVRFHQNGRYVGCASAGSGEFGSPCRSIEGPPPRTWANATG